MLTLFTLLSAMDPRVSPEACKVYMHLPNGGAKPLEMFRQGTLDAFQRRQKKDIYKRPLLVSLIRIAGPRYLFAGVYAVGDRRRIGVEMDYDLEPLPAFDSLVGRLQVHYPRGLKISPCYSGEAIADELEVLELTQAPLTLPPFLGYRFVDLPKGDLDLLMKSPDIVWRTALTEARGIYLITDTSPDGGLYVGMAAGEDGFWGRWSCYSRHGHGGNQKMIDLLDRLSDGHAENFRFSILEVAPPDATRDEIELREIAWKKRLKSREGLNAN